MFTTSSRNIEYPKHCWVLTEDKCFSKLIIMLEERKVGILVGQPPKSELGADNLSYLNQTLQYFGLELLDTSDVLFDPSRLPHIDFLINVFPNQDSMSDLLVGYALGSNIPTLVLSRERVDPRISHFSGKSVLSIDNLSRGNVSASVRKFVLWMDGLEEEGRLQDKVQRFFTNGGLVIDYARHKVTLDEELVHFTPTEFRIVGCLANNVDEVVERDTLLWKVWGRGYEFEYHVLRVNIARIRGKIGENRKIQEYIKTVPGVGYIMPRIENN